ncbi:MAG: choice-of-anchor D domain-containing protein [Deltaproteobacteria bacterium]|nr:MAG: choice-of-anchor D domain-containing protein [Deltaproteobacteria bacterium]
MRAASIALLSFVASVGCSDYSLTGQNAGDRPGNTNGGGHVDGPAPEIKLDPESFSFGWRQVDCPSDPRSVKVTNIGDMELRVDEIRLAGAGAGHFSLYGQPEDLAPGSSFEFQVGFTAPAYQDYEVQVEIDSNDPRRPTATVDVMGSGADYSTNEEAWVQPEVDSVDVLFIVDNSCSMSGLQDQLGSRFRSFIEAFHAIGADYQIGVTSTDMDDPTHSGHLLGPKKIMTGDDPDVYDLFVEAASLGTSGSPDERGTDAAYAALTEPLISGPNAGLIRDDATLSVIILSDEDDYSRMETPDFISWFNAYKSDPDKSSFSAIVGDWHDTPGAIGCSSGGFPPVMAESGRRYIMVQEATGGVFQSICEDDFDAVLTHMAYGSSGLHIAFELEREPITIGGITVTVDGVEIPRHPVNGWYYDAHANAVRFARSAIPGPGSVIIITYMMSEDC